jgi:hypothetical protein
VMQEGEECGHRRASYRFVMPALVAGIHVFL